MNKRAGYTIHLELVPEGESAWGFTWAMDGAGGSGHGGGDQQAALLKAYRTIRKELRRLVETKEAKSARLDKARRVAALRKSKDKGTI